MGKPYLKQVVLDNNVVILSQIQNEAYLDANNRRRGDTPKTGYGVDLHQKQHTQLCRVPTKIG